jgi:hypothetical protein
MIVSRALPNPTGKDRRPSSPPTNEQLNNEWMEITNNGTAAESVDGVALSHYTFNTQCAKTGEDTLMALKGTVLAGHSVRFHTGSGTAWTEGSVRHLYLGRGNYAWNNVCGDTAVIRSAMGGWSDYAAYDRNPPEGIVLVRVPGTYKLSDARAARSA